MASTTPVVIPATQSWAGFNPVCAAGIKLLYNSGGGGGAAGTYLGDVVVPAYSYLVDVQLHGISLWTGSSTITAIVGDADDDNGFFTTTNLKATDLIANESISVAAGTALAGGLVGAYIANSQWTLGSGTYARYAPVARTITCKVSAGGTCTAGETHMIVLFIPPFNSSPLGTPSYLAT